MKKNNLLKSFTLLGLALALVFGLSLDRSVEAIDSQVGEDLEKLDFEIEKTYVTVGANVRDLEGKKLGYIHKGALLNGRSNKAYVEFTYQGQKAKVSKAFLDYNINSYQSKGANVRDLAGNKLGYLSTNQVIEGYRDGAYVYFSHNGKAARIHRSVLGLNTQSYTARGVNVRNIHGLKLGRLDFGAVFTGYEKDGHIYLNYRQLPSSVDSRYTIKNKAFISRGVNVRDLNGKKLGYLKSGEVIYGYRTKGYIYFNYQGQRARVLDKFIR